MIELGLFAIAAFWIVCAVLHQGLFVAYFQGHYKYPDEFRKDLGAGLLIGLMGGPIALLVGFCLSGFAERGFQWRRK